MNPYADLQRIAFENPLAEAPGANEPAAERYFTRAGNFSIGLTVNK